MRDAIATLLPDQGRHSLTTDEQAEIEDCLDAAAEWAAGRLPWQEAARIGGLAHRGRPSPAYTRFVAIAFTPPGDLRRAALRRLVDTLVTAEGYRITRQGTYTTGELHAHDAAIRWVRANEDVA